MVAESNAANIFKIGHLVFEILHDQHFKMSYLVNSNHTEIMFSVINRKPFPDQAAAKGSEIGQVCHKL